MNLLCFITVESINSNLVFSLHELLQFIFFHINFSNIGILQYVGDIFITSVTRVNIVGWYLNIALRSSEIRHLKLKVQLCELLQFNTISILRGDSNISKTLFSIQIPEFSSCIVFKVSIGQVIFAFLTHFSMP